MNKVKELLKEYGIDDAFTYRDSDTGDKESGLLSSLVEDVIKDLNLIEADQWISVSDELPDFIKDDRKSNSSHWVYGVSLFDGRQYRRNVKRRENDGKTWWIDNHGERVTVTHWMPLPKLPNV